MIIILHTSEVRKKCSLAPIRDYPGLTFYDETNYIVPETSLLLHPDGPPLMDTDRDRPVILIDAIWKNYNKIYKGDLKLNSLETRSIKGFVTAYPRKGRKRPHPSNYLASIEVIFCCGVILNRPGYLGVLDHYYFKDEFLSLNRQQLESYGHES